LEEVYYIQLFTLEEKNRRHKALFITFKEGREMINVYFAGEGLHSSLPCLWKGEKDFSLTV